MVSKQQKKWKNLLLGIDCLILIFLGACAPEPDTNWAALPVFEPAETLNNLSPTWDNGQESAALDIRIYLEPYRQSDYMKEPLAYVSALEDAHVRIYDYPVQGEIESFMVSGIGQCIAEASPDLYLQYLTTVATTTERLADELVMAKIAKSILGQNYDRKCLQRNIQALKNVFENDNPLNLNDVPVTIINGKIIYGNLSVSDLQSLIQQAQ